MDNKMKPCVIVSKGKMNPDNRQTMNPEEIITTTEIKVEVQLETASIVKVETTKGQPNKPASIEDADSSQKFAVAAPSHQVEKEKTRAEIKAERQAKKLAKQAKKQKGTAVNSTEKTSTFNATDTSLTPNATGSCQAQVNIKVPDFDKVTETTSKVDGGSEKTHEQIKFEREAKKLIKQAAKATKADSNTTMAMTTVTNQLNQVKHNENTVQDKTATKPALTKAERRAIQEGQRAAKAQAQAQKTTKQHKDKTDTSITSPATANKSLKASTKSISPSDATSSTTIKRIASNSPAKTVRFNDGNVKLFSHLEKPNTDANLFINNTHIHPSIARLGEQYAKRTIVGSNARCIAFLNAIKTVIQDYETPPKKEFNRSLESFIANCVDYLHKCRTLAVSVVNAHKSIKQVLMQLPKDVPESELKDRLFIFIDTYIENQIGKAAQAINSMIQEKISNGDVILTFGCSSLINYICEEAQARKVNFHVIVVDSRPFCEGRELLRRLTAKEISCSYVLINAVSFVMPEVTKVLLGAHALLANGYVMARAGTAQVALVARSFNVPVLVCCETHKFSERLQTDAIVYNELGNPDDIVVDDKCCLANWQTKYKMSPLNLNYDITPPELVTAVVTEVSVLPCTSVPVILRIKPDWLV